jgi:phage shock protein A
VKILARVVNMFRADIHAVVDQFENKDLLLKQYLRDMSAALEQKERYLKELLDSRQGAVASREKYLLQSRKLEQNLKVAIQNGKEDIARMLIRKLKPAVMLRNEHDRQLAFLDREISAFTELVEHQKFQYKTLRLKAVEYFHRKERHTWHHPLVALDGDSNSELVLRTGRML